MLRVVLLLSLLGVSLLQIPVIRCQSLGLKQIYYNRPYSVTLAQKSLMSTTYDNICFNYFRLAGNTSSLLNYVSRVRDNCTFDVVSSIVSEGESGIAEAVSTFCMYTDSLLGLVPGCAISLISRNILSGTCDLLTGPDLPSYVYGISPFGTKLNSTCRDRTLSVLREQDYCTRKFYFLPMKYPHKCVTCQPGMGCPN